MAHLDNVYSPSQDVVDSAYVPDYDALRATAAADPLTFWEERARELEPEIPAVTDRLGFDGDDRIQPATLPAEADEHPAFDKSHAGIGHL